MIIICFETYSTLQPDSARRARASRFLAGIRHLISIYAQQNAYAPKASPELSNAERNPARQSCISIPNASMSR
jgi:hypothetical protein